MKDGCQAAERPQAWLHQCSQVSASHQCITCLDAWLQLLMQLDLWGVSTGLSHELSISYVHCIQPARRYTATGCLFLLHSPRVGGVKYLSWPVLTESRTQSRAPAGGRRRYESGSEEGEDGASTRGRARSASRERSPSPQLQQGPPLHLRAPLQSGPPSEQLRLVKVRRNTLATAE